MRARPWSNWSPKPGTWRVVTEDSFTAYIIIVLSFQWSHNPVLIHIPPSKTQPYNFTRTLRGLWGRPPLKKKYIIWSMNRTINVQKTSWTYFIISSKSTTPKAILLFLEFIVIKLWNTGIQVYNVLVKLLLSTMYSTFFIRNYVLQKCVWCKKRAILFCLFMLTLCHNRQYQNKLETFGLALLTLHYRRQILKLLKLFSLIVQYLHTSLPYSHDCCKSEIIRRMLFIKFVLCSLSRMLPVDG